MAGLGSEDGDGEGNIFQIFSAKFLIVRKNAFPDEQSFLTLMFQTGKNLPTNSVLG